MAYRPLLCKIGRRRFGGKWKQAFYRRLYFFGYFRHQLGLFGVKQFLSVSKIVRPPYVIALGAVTRLRELGIDVSGISTRSLHVYVLNLRIDYMVNANEF